MLAKAKQLLHGAKLGDLALRAFLRQPVQKTGDCGPIGFLRIAVALLFDRVLDGLGQHGGIAHLQHICSRAFKRMEDGSDGVGGINRNALARQLLKPGDEGIAGADRDGIAQMLAQLRRHLLFSDEQVRRAVAANDDV